MTYDKDEAEALLSACAKVFTHPVKVREGKACAELIEALTCLKAGAFEFDQPNREKQGRGAVVVVTHKDTKRSVEVFRRDNVLLVQSFTDAGHEESEVALRLVGETLEDSKGGSALAAVVKEVLQLMFIEARKTKKEEESEVSIVCDRALSEYQARRGLATPPSHGGPPTSPPS